MVFDSELIYVSHCKEKINRPYSMLGLIKRNNEDTGEIKEAFVTL